MRRHAPQKCFELRVRVLNTSAPIAKARWNQRATTEATALELKLRCICVLYLPGITSSEMNQASLTEM
jgi:hypothetical protein